MNKDFTFCFQPGSELWLRLRGAADNLTEFAINARPNNILIRAGHQYSNDEKLAEYK